MPDLKLPDGVTYEWLIHKPITIIIIIIIGLIARWLIHRAINRTVRKAKTGSVKNALTRGKGDEKPAQPNIGARRQQRADALGSLMRSITTGIIVAIIVLEVLDQLGIDLAPLIASAGIIGVAFGFGAQSLVKDFISGVFMIMEDQYGVGDWVDLGEASGGIESVGLRVTRLRDVNGTVWYVRNGEVVRVGNMTQNWAYSVLDTTVGYEADIDRVEELIQQIADQMYHAAEYRGVIIQPPEVWGVQSLDKDGVVIRLVLTTAPMKQWGVERELRGRIKNTFDAEGIRIPSFSLPFDPEQAHRG